MRQMRRTQGRGGAVAAPPEDGKPTQLPSLVGESVEMYLQGDPLAQDEHILGKLLYVSSAWVGFVEIYRAQMFFDHIPISSIRKVRDASGRRPPPSKKDPYRRLDPNAEPEKIVDLVGQEVVVELQGNQLLKDTPTRARLLYVKKNWIGIASFYSNRTSHDHIPLSSVRKVTKVVLLKKMGRFVKKNR